MSLVSHQFELWDGSTQGPLLAVGQVYWRETETTISEADRWKSHQPIRDEPEEVR